jgi:hypothetical protein
MSCESEMSARNSIPAKAATAVRVLLNNCARIKSGDEVLILPMSMVSAGGGQPGRRAGVAVDSIRCQLPGNQHFGVHPQATICPSLATFKVGDSLACDGGYLTALDDPAVLAVAAEYLGHPGLGVEPRSC